MNSITKEDLMKVRQELLTEIQDLKRLLQVGNDQHYLKNKDVKKIFECSDSKLESLRKSGKLPFIKLQGTLYYKKEDIYALFQGQSLNLGK
jgi:hypothetical protein